jgi:transcriptional regulator with XRE-family HTH domain
MITNKRQYRITRSEAERFEQALARAEEQGAELDPRLRRAMREALESQLEELREEIAEYDALCSGQVSVMEIDSLTKLPEALIRARIAANLTQKELAARLQLKEQQIQRYEATRYSGVDLKRLQAVAEALGVRIHERITLHTHIVQSHMVQSPRLARYLEEARIEELRREWEAKGYRAAPRDVADDLRADLVVERAGERVIIEVKTAETLASARPDISRLARLAASEPNTTFRLVVTNPPLRKSVEIEGLADRLSTYLRYHLPVVLEELSPHTSVESVYGVEIVDAEVRPTETRARGNAVVEVRLQHLDGGIGREGGEVAYEVFPLKFDVTLNTADLSIAEVTSLEIDTSSFRE